MKFTLNVDHVGTLRNARGEQQPDPVTYALIAEQYGVDGIVVHLREDRRHVNERDVRLLREMITTKLDLEMAAVDEIIEIACDVQPELATLVPEKRQELTTEGGLNVVDNIKQLKSAIERLHEADILVSLFVEPDIEQIDAAAGIEADLIEIHTGNYANAETEDDMFEELDRIKLAAQHAKKLGLGVNAGHGLDYNN
ncbi:MAG: pyridoxine 5'-phosphate synthase, partial [Bacteroidota bacterium]